MSRVVVIGGGASGMTAAVFAAYNGHEVHIYEKNEKLGKKLFITGKGRCNLTNACDPDELSDAVRSNPKFLCSAFHSFNNFDVIDFFENLGVKTKVERGRRVFPVSDRASDVTDALKMELKRLKVRVHLNRDVTRVFKKGDVIYVRTRPSRSQNVAGAAPFTGYSPDILSSFGGSDRANAESFTADSFDSGEIPHFPEVISGTGEDAPYAEETVKDRRDAASGFEEAAADAVIIATGGMSYRSTGSTGDGYAFAKSLGHEVRQPVPSLVPMNVREPYVRSLAGLSPRNVRVAVFDDGEKIYGGFGEMLFTHFGVSGPLILDATGTVGRSAQKKDLKLVIDFKPALDEGRLDERILRDFTGHANKEFKNSLSELLPAKLIPVIVSLSGIDPGKKTNSVTAAERHRLLSLIKGFSLTLSGLRGFDEAIVTKGGVNVSEVNPRTMESKHAKGIYFAGEVLDVDAVTGGFNLQIAWSTGHAAGSSVR